MNETRTAITSLQKKINRGGGGRGGEERKKESGEEGLFTMREKIKKKVFAIMAPIFFPSSCCQIQSYVDNYFTIPINCNDQWRWIFVTCAQ